MVQFVEIFVLLDRQGSVLGVVEDDLGGFLFKHNRRHVRFRFGDEQEGDGVQESQMFFVLREWLSHGRG